MKDRQLSKNFWLSEFTRSQMAERKGIDMTPPPAVVDNLNFLCTQLLEPIREQIDLPFVITSGYRPPELNKAIGGSKNSAHVLGLAADGYFLGMDNRDAARIIADCYLVTYQLDQLIYEGRWLHIAAGRRGLDPRRETLTAHFEPGGVRYTEGIA